MQHHRKVKKVVQGTAQQDGAGVKLVRVLGLPTVKDFDPFLMLDAFDSTNSLDYIKGFPWHPHRGIETVTYLIHGDIEHGDSLGNKGSIKDGSCQWMSAGSGIIHQEMPQKCPHMLGVQLWINLPKKDKMTAPAYRDIKSETIPRVEDATSGVRIISGSYKGIKGPLEGGAIKTLYLDVTLKSGAKWSMETDEKATVFAYILSGGGVFEDGAEPLPAKRAVLMGDGKVINVQAAKEGIRFLLLAARPLKEPVAWGGPIVMNTEEELATAFAELESGSFIKHKKYGV